MSDLFICNGCGASSPKNYYGQKFCSDECKKKIVKVVFKREPKDFIEGNNERLRESNKKQQKIIKELRLRLAKYETPVIPSDLWGITKF